MSPQATIRFSQVDAAGIIFFARYFELLARYFPGSPITTTPIALQARFPRPCHLGDKLMLGLDQKEGEWSYSGVMGGDEYFRINSLHDTDRPSSLSAPADMTTVFRGGAELVGNWATDSSGRMQLSRFFELLNETVEKWFLHKLDLTFAEMTDDRKLGVPTIQFRTRCKALPKPGDSVEMWMRPIERRKRSVTFKTWLMRGDECLVENEQVMVFVSKGEHGIKSTPIPHELRSKIDAQIVVSGTTNERTNVAT